MKRHKKLTVYPQRITVKGRGRFPFDMLRYDRCFPATEEDTGQMFDYVGPPREIKLLRFPINPSPPTFERWASFTWAVVDWEPMT